jgi:LmbE family N-acetylglucosaminyl deacetylase
VGPHPDDIEIGAGATAAKLAAMGKEVCFLVCLDGRFGENNAPEGIRGERLVEKRRQEAIASAAMLGVADVRFLDLCDGGFYDQRELLRKIAQVAGEFQPDVILAPDPSVTSECHVDHLNVGAAARQVACFAPYGGIMEGYGAKTAPVQALAYYMTAKPNRFVKTSGYLSLQLKAVFGCHLSQFPEGCEDAKSISLYLKLRSVDFGIRSFKGCAEGFRVLGVTQMHCLPEAGN